MPEGESTGAVPEKAREPIMGYAGSADFTRAPTVTIAVKASINDAFEYHPWDSAQTARGVKVRAALVAAVEAIVENVPPSADRSAAIRKLRECRMDCNSAITHNGRY